MILVNVIYVKPTSSFLSLFSFLHNSVFFASCLLFFNSLIKPAFFFTVRLLGEFIVCSFCCCLFLPRGIVYLDGGLFGSYT